MSDRRMRRSSLRWVALALPLLLLAAPSGAAATVGTTERVSVASDGSEGNGSSFSSSTKSISDDGRHVVFASTAGNLVSGDTNSQLDVFVHDRETDATVRVSVTAEGSQSNGPSTGGAVSADGRYVTFFSLASNLVPGDTNSRPDIFIHERDTGVIERVSVATDGTEANGFSNDPEVSDDGRYVVFVSSSNNLVPGDTNGANDVFVHDRDTGETVRISVASDGSEANGPSTLPAISGDGGYIAFTSSASNLVADDTNGQADVFVHDLQSGTTERVSLTFDGGEGNQQSSTPALSADGRFVAFFSTADNLVPGDTNGFRDIFVRDRQNGTTERISVAADGTQTDAGSTDPTISPDGRFAAFSSQATSLVPGDTNGQVDVFVHDRETGTTERVSVATDGSEANDVSGVPALSRGARYVAFFSGARNLVPGDANAVNDVFVRERPVLEILPDPLDFGPVLVGETGGPLSVSITNSRLPQVTTTEITAPQAPFTATGDTCGPLPFTLSQGESCELTYSFTPGSAGVYEDSVTLTTDAPDGPHTFTLSGFAVDDALEIAPIVLDFGGVLPGETAGSSSVTLSNAGVATFEISSVGTPNAPFTAAGGTCGAAPFSLAPFASCTLDFDFSPTHSGAFEEFIAVSSDAPSGPDGFTLRGEGISRALSFKPAALSFGNIPLGEIGGPQTVTVLNVGALDVTLGAPSNPGAAFELIENTCGSVLPVGASCQLSYRYTPVTAEGSDGVVVITSDAAFNPHLVPLFGAGTVHGTELVSRASGAEGAKGDLGGSSGAIISADGRLVVFSSQAANLHPDDTDNNPNEFDVFVRDVLSKETLLVSRASGIDGEEGNLGSGGTSISADGRFIAFESAASNLHPDDGDQMLDIYVRDTQTHETILVSRAAGAEGVKSDGTSQVGAVSADGRYIAFESDATNLDPDNPDGIGSVYVRDLQTHELFLVSRATGVDGVIANLDAEAPSISGDGRRVAFQSRATNLHPDDGDDRMDIFVRDLQTHETTLVSRANGSDGAKSNLYSVAPSISADGTRVAFESQSNNLHPDDARPCSIVCDLDIYVRDLQTHETILVSRASGVQGAKGDPGNSQSPSISATGRFVAFHSTARNLHPDISGAGHNVFARDLLAHETFLASRAAGAGDAGSGSSTHPTISAEGRYVAFSSNASNLHPDDPEFDPWVDVFLRDLLGTAGPQLVLEPGSVVFGTLAGTGQSATEVVTLTNTGTEMLEITGIEPPSPPFALLGGSCGASPNLLPGESCTFEFGFSPDEFGEFEDVAIIVSTVPQGRHTLPLTGASVTDAEITVDPNAMALTLEQGDSAGEILTVGNAGTSGTLQWVLTEEAEPLAGAILRAAGSVSAPQSGEGSGTREHQASGDGLAPATNPSASPGASGPNAMSDFTPNSVATTITHSAASDTVPGTAAACPANASDNMFLRTFTLTEFGIFSEFDVTEVTFGIEELATAEPVTVNLYTLEGEFLYTNLDLIGTATKVLQPQALTLVSVPVSATIPAGATLVVEIVMPASGSAEARFWPGANSWGESAPSYIALRPADLLCTASQEREPVPYSAIGWPGSHLVMSVAGQTEPLNCSLPDWLTVSPGGGLVGPGSSEPVTATSDASGLALGDHAAFMCLSSTDAKQPLTVIPHVLTVEEAAPGTLGIKFTPTVIDFGPASVGASAGPASVTLANTGDAELQVSTVSDPVLPFARSGGSCGDAPFALPVDGSCTLNFTFNPTQSGNAIATVDLISNAPSSPDVLGLTGFGILTSTEVRLEPERLYFGNVEYLQLSAPLTINLRNGATTPLLVQGVAVAADDYTLMDGCSGLTLDPGLSCAVEVWFEPQQIGTRVGWLVVTTDATNSPHSAKLVGSGIAADGVWSDGYE